MSKPKRGFAKIFNELIAVPIALVAAAVTLKAKG